MNEEQVYDRHMRVEDIPIVLEIERKSFPYPFGEVLIGNLYHGAPELCYIIEYSKEIIGFLLAGYTAIPKQAHILSLAIKPGYRGRGFGRRILVHFLERTKILGYSSIKLEVQVDNDKAIKLYEELGFRIETRIRKYYQDNTDAFLMLKSID